MRRQADSIELHASVPGTLRDLDYLRFCAGFERIEIGVGADGLWSVCYPDAAHAALRLHLARLDVVLGLVRLDGEGRVLHLPDLPAMEAALRSAGQPPEVPRATPPPKPGLARWDVEAGRPTASGAAAQRQSLSFAEAAQSPCARCAAPCCQSLVFDLDAGAEAVSTMAELLHFPGVEVALTRHGWKVLVKTTCRHFDVERAGCGIWGRPERPLVCSRYDAYACAYRSWLLEPQTEPFVRLDAETLPLVRLHLPMNDEGRIIGDVTPEDLRAILAVVAPDRLPPMTWGLQ